MSAMDDQRAHDEAEDVEARRLAARDLPPGWFFPAGDYADAVSSAPEPKQREVSTDRYKLVNAAEAAAKVVVGSIIGLTSDDKVGALAAGMERFDLHLTALLNAEFELREAVMEAAARHRRIETGTATRHAALAKLAPHADPPPATPHGWIEVDDAVRAEA